MCDHCRCFQINGTEACSEYQDSMNKENELTLKIKALLEGLEIQHIDMFMEEAQIDDYRNLGVMYLKAAMDKIKEAKNG